MSAVAKVLLVEDEPNLARGIRENLAAEGYEVELIQRANAQGLERLQARLAQRDAASPPIESLKALYDLWVDAAEDAYAEIALSDETRPSKPSKAGGGRKRLQRAGRPNVPKTFGSRAR